MVRIVTAVLVIVLIILGACFSALNAQPILINYIFGSATLPLAVILFMAFALGIILTALLLGFRVYCLRFKNKRLNSKLKHLEIKTSEQDLAKDLK